MARVIFDFDADEDRERIVIHTHVTDIVHTLYSIREAIRFRLKYNSEKVTDDERAFLESTETMIWETPGYESWS